MKDYQQRVVNEKNGLDEKLVKLNEFLPSETFKSLAPDERTRLIKQQSIMQEYSIILGERISVFD